MKHFPLLLLFLLIGQFLSAQSISINNNGAPPHPSAILDLQSTNKGLLIPRISIADLPNNPPNGLMVYITTGNPGFFIFGEGEWKKIAEDDGSLAIWMKDSSNRAFYENAVSIGSNFGNSQLQVSGSINNNIFQAVGNNGTMFLINEKGVSLGEFNASPPANGLSVKGKTTIGSQDTLGTLNLTPVGDLNVNGFLTPENSALSIGNANSGLFIDRDQIETTSDLKLNYVSNGDISLANGGGGVSIGFPEASPPAKGLNVKGKTTIGSQDTVGTLHLAQNGDIGENGQLTPLNSALSIGSSNFGMYLDRDQIETTTDLKLNYVSNGDISLASGGGEVSIGFPDANNASTNPFAQLQVNNKGTIDKFGDLFPLNSAIAIGDQTNGLLMDQDAIETTGSDLKIQTVSGNDIFLGNNETKTSLGFGDPYLDPVGRLQIKSLGSINNLGLLQPLNSAIAIGDQTNGLLMDQDAIETTGSDLKIQTVSGNDIFLGNNETKTSLGFGDPYINPVGRLQINPLGSLNNNGVLEPENSALTIGTASSGLLFDGNQMEAAGSTLFLNLNSAENVSIAKGGGKLGVGIQTPDYKLDVIDDDWQIRLRNDNEINDNSWYIGASGPSWNGGGATGKLLFGAVSNSLSSLFTLTEAGRIGLGTHDPQTKVHIVGGNSITPTFGSFLSIGHLYSENLAFDENEIMGRNNGEVSTLAINRLGGNVGVGTAGPAASLHVKALANVDPFRADVPSGSRIRVTANGGLSLGSFASVSNNEIVFNGDSPGYFKMEFDGNNSIFRSTEFESDNLGQVGNPFQSVYSNWFLAGTIVNFQAYSDRRIKENIRPLDNALAIINQVEGVSYALTKEHYYRGRAAHQSEKTRKNQMGFIAQDLEKILPALVYEDPDTGLKSVGYMGMIPYLVESIKELTQQQAEMKSLILEQQKVIQTIKNEVNK